MIHRSLTLYIEERWRLAGRPVSYITCDGIYSYIRGIKRSGNIHRQAGQQQQRCQTASFRSAVWFKQWSDRRVARICEILLVVRQGSGLNGSIAHQKTTKWDSVNERSSATHFCVCVCVRSWCVIENALTGVWWTVVCKIYCVGGDRAGHFEKKLNL